jgi:hypothetical protein
VSEDHKIRSMLKRQSAKVWAALHGRRAELICFVLLCFVLFRRPRHYFRCLFLALVPLASSSGYLPCICTSAAYLARHQLLRT